MIEIKYLQHYNLSNDYGFIWNILTENKLPLVCFISSGNDSNYVNVAMARINSNRIEISARGICYCDFNLNKFEAFLFHCTKNNIQFILGDLEND
jgi:hypothetical protein